MVQVNIRVNAMITLGPRQIGCFCFAVDGGWSDWEDWGPCSVTCDNGTWTRLRTCSNPTPDHGGKQCEGDSMESSECFTDEECIKGTLMKYNRN